MTLFTIPASAKTPQAAYINAVVLTLGFAAHALAHDNLSLTWILLGTYIWEVIEYVTHRGVMHGVFDKHSRAYHYVHGHHHAHPDRMDRQHVQLYLFYAMMLPSYVILRCIISVTMSPEADHVGIASSISSGAMMSYVAFEAVHFFSHVKHSALCGGPMHTYHVQHHSTPCVNYSFTCTFLDYWFGTIHKDYSFDGSVTTRLAACAPVPPLINFVALGMIMNHKKHVA